MAIHITSKTIPLKLLRPTSRDEFISLIVQELELQGPDANLNFIDTSLITDMSGLFANIRYEIRNIKIDRWDTSNVTDMSHMLSYCINFNADLSGWMSRMCEKCRTCSVNAEN